MRYADRSLLIAENGERHHCAFGPWSGYIWKTNAGIELELEMPSDALAQDGYVPLFKDGITVLVDGRNYIVLKRMIHIESGGVTNGPKPKDRYVYVSLRYGIALLNIETLADTARIDKYTVVSESLHRVGIDEKLASVRNLPDGGMEAIIAPGKEIPIDIGNNATLTLGWKRRASHREGGVARVQIDGKTGYELNFSEGRTFDDLRSEVMKVEVFLSIITGTPVWRDESSVEIAGQTHPVIWNWNVSHHRREPSFIRCVWGVKIPSATELGALWHSFHGLYDRTPTAVFRLVHSMFNIGIDQDEFLDAARAAEACFARDIADRLIYRFPACCEKRDQAIAENRAADKRNPENLTFQQKYSIIGAFLNFVPAGSAFDAGVSKDIRNAVAHGGTLNAAEIRAMPEQADWFKRFVLALLLVGAGKAAEEALNSVAKIEFLGPLPRL